MFPKAPELLSLDHSTSKQRFRRLLQGLVRPFYFELEKPITLFISTLINNNDLRYWIGTLPGSSNFEECLKDGFCGQE